MTGFKVSLAAMGLLSALPGLVQSQTTYTGSNATGSLTLSTTVNVMQVAQANAAGVQALGAERAFLRAMGAFEVHNLFSTGAPKHLPRHIRPPYLAMLGAKRNLALLGVQPLASTGTPSTTYLNVVNGGAFNFNGLTQVDQLDANGGNSLVSLEPPNPSIAVANGYILEGVNNAIQVYDRTGKALLPAPISSNELFGLAPFLDQAGVYGPFPTDMQVFYDPDIQRWFVLQRAQDEDALGNFIDSSHLYLAVSQTPNPTGVYNVYTADTTDLQDPGCPCVDDYPQIGADRFGFYISSNEFNAGSGNFAQHAVVLALSKASLGSGASTPTAFRFVLPFETGYESTVQPATTPPGASYLVADGGVEYFASTSASSEGGETVAIWAMSNTSSLGSNSPNLSLMQTIVQTLSYGTPRSAQQRPGPLPLGSSLSPPEQVPPSIDGGDNRTLSLVYAGSRLYLTLATSVLDQSSNEVTGGALVIISTALRQGSLQTKVLNQSYLIVNGNYLLRPSVAVNPQGIGAIAATLVGPSWYPSAVYIPISTFATPSTAYVAAAGTAPEDGYTAYGAFNGVGNGNARWGDRSTAVAASDGSVWTATEYIGNLPRSTYADWDTLVTQIKP